MSFWYYLASAVCLTASGVILWLAAGQQNEHSGPSDGRTAAAGAALYRQHCADCHGASLQGQPNWQQRKADGRLPAPPHDASGHTWHHPREQLFDITKYGLTRFAPPGYPSDMPAFAPVLTDEQIAAVLSFIEAQWPPEIRARRK